MPAVPNRAASANASEPADGRTFSVPTINERARRAGDCAAAADELRALANDRSPKVRQAVAANPHTPADVLIELADDANTRVRYAVSANPSPHALTAALSSSDSHTRGIAARRADLDAAARRVLLTDPASFVREQLARTTTDSETLAALVKDPEPDVRASTLDNPRLPPADIAQLARDRIATVRATAAASRRVTPEDLTLLAADKSVIVRFSVLLMNPERLDLAAVLADDPDERTAHQARAQLEDPRRFTAYLGDVDLVH